MPAQRKRFSEDGDTEDEVLDQEAGEAYWDNYWNKDADSNSPNEDE
jgi:hypothetical protein